MSLFSGEDQYLIKAKESDNKKLEDINETLRQILALFNIIPNWRSPKIKYRKLPKPVKSIVAPYDEKITQIIHLFNLIVSVQSSSDEKDRVLLTGDAHPYLFEMVRIRSGGKMNLSAMQIPHHGSAENVHQWVYEMINCKRFVVSADAYKQWRHPSQTLVTTLQYSQNKHTQLFCTNDHKYCQIRHSGSKCFDRLIEGIAITEESIGWLVDGEPCEAKPCPCLLEDQD